MPHDRRDVALLETDLLADPLAQFQRWLEEAKAAGMLEPTAMTLATASTAGQPSARMVLFKGLHNGGLTFFTNYGSSKGADLARNPRAALVFWWDRLERQVRVEGRVEKLPRALSEQYFHQRPRNSQLSAAISQQSKVVARRQLLEQRYAQREAQLGGAPVALPDNWGGYVVRPSRLEFWQGRSGRLHDRLVYQPEGQGWRIERLEP